MMFYSLSLSWTQTEDLHVKFLKAILHHISYAIMIFQESICWLYPVGCSPQQKKTVASIHQDALIWVMGLLVNLLTAAPPAGARKTQKRIRGEILTSLPVLLAWSSFLIHKAAVGERTLPPTSAPAMPFHFKTCKNIVITVKTVAFANGFH